MIDTTLKKKNKQNFARARSAGGGLWPSVILTIVRLISRAFAQKEEIRRALLGERMLLARHQHPQQQLARRTALARPPRPRPRRKEPEVLLTSLLRSPFAAVACSSFDSSAGSVGGGGEKKGQSSEEAAAARTTTSTSTSTSTSSASNALAAASQRLSALLAEREAAKVKAATSLSRAERLEERAAALRRAAAEVLAVKTKSGRNEADDDDDADATDDNNTAEARKLLEQRAQVSEAAIRARLRAIANRELASKLGEAARVARAEMDALAAALEVGGEGERER